MGQISSNVGLVSGIDYGSLIDQLIQVEARPRSLIQNRNKKLQTQQTAFQAISAKLLAVKNAANTFSSDKAFNQTTAASSNESVLTASSDTGAASGNYTFSVAQLVSAQQSISKGFADASATPVGPGTLTFERGEARLDSTTKLADLNGGTGFSRGLVRITDRSGATATVDLSAAVSVNEVVDTLNGASGVSVVAGIDGDRLTLTDATGSADGALTVADVGATATATSLGLAKSDTSGAITGDAINTVGDQTLLASLNDGNGVRGNGAGNDLQVTTGSGTYAIDVDGATTLGEIAQRLEDASAGNVTLQANAQGTGVSVVDTASSGTLSVAGLNGSHALADLGLENATASGGQISGNRVIASINSKLLKNLDGGQGLDALNGGAATIAITDSTGGATEVDLSGARSVSDLLDAINQAGAGVKASLNQAGNGIALTDTAGGTGQLTIDDAQGQLAQQLGIQGSFNGSAQGRDLQLQYITEATTLDSLGVQRGKFTLRDSSGATATIDLTQGNETTLQDVIGEINSRGLAVNARLNDTGDGLLIEDQGPGTVELQVSEEGSTTAADLGLAGSAETPGDNLDGSFAKTVRIGAGDTLQDVASKINAAGVGINAGVINDGSAGAPYRLSLSARTAGSDGAFVFDDGGLDLGVSTLAKAQDATVFYGSSDPRQAVVITSKSNTLKNVIPGATIDLKSTSDQPVQVTISQDDGSISTTVSDFVKAFNGAIDSIDKVDSYDAETQKRGILLGNSTVGTIRNQLFTAVTSANGGLTGQFKALSQIGVTVREGRLQLDQGKLDAALQQDREGVKNLFTFQQFATDEDGNKTDELVSRGVGVEINNLLDTITDPTEGRVQSAVDRIQSRIDSNNSRIDDLTERLADKRARLEKQFAGLETALTRLQGQQSALGQLAQAAANSKSSLASLTAKS